MSVQSLHGCSLLFGHHYLLIFPLSSQPLRWNADRQIAGSEINGRRICRIVCFILVHDKVITTLLCSLWQLSPMKSMRKPCHFLGDMKLADNEKTWNLCPNMKAMMTEIIWFINRIVFFIIIISVLVWLCERLGKDGKGFFHKKCFSEMVNNRIC